MRRTGGPLCGGLVSCPTGAPECTRYLYASTLLDAGESIKALAEFLGHSDPAFTLRRYAHLMPTSEERTRSAVDRLFQAINDAGCRPLTTPSA